MAGRLEGSGHWLLIRGLRDRPLQSLFVAHLDGQPALVAQRIEHLTTDQKVGSSNLSGRAWSEGVEVFGPPQWVSILPSQFSREQSADWLVRLVGWCGRSGAYGLGLYVDVWLGWPGPRCTDMNETRTELRRAGRCPQVQSQMS